MSASHDPSPTGPVFETWSHENDVDHYDWRPILQASNQVVLYNPHSHALSVSTNSHPAIVSTRRRKCWYCKQSLPPGFVDYDDYNHPQRSHLHHPHDESGLDLGDEEYELAEEDLADSEEWYDSAASLSTAQHDDNIVETVSTDPAYHSRASDYFQLLAIANERVTSRGPSPPTLVGSYLEPEPEPEDAASEPEGRSGSRGRSPRSSKGAAKEESKRSKTAFPAEKMAEGYFKTFFQEEYKLGMGANGTVYLCQHVLDGNPLGHFAVKKIAVGESHSYLIKILREVRLLERLHHPNIITYHHAWLENSQFSSFGPTVPTLHVLMQWAEGGSLDDFVDIRLGRKPAHVHMHPYLHSTTGTSPQPQESQTAPTTPQTPQSALPPSTPQPPSGVDPQSRAARIKAFRAYQRAPPEEKERMKREMEAVLGYAPAPAETSGVGGVGMAQRQEWTPVHLLSAEEVKSLFQDVVEGLAFLHDRAILHLDLKPGNVLLTWDEGRLIPRAMLSDFGTSRDMIDASRMQRSGNTGTLEYTAPETLPSPQTGLLSQIDSKADMWSLGMILHKLLFFKLPYRYAAAGDANNDPRPATDASSVFDPSTGAGSPPSGPIKDEKDKLDRLEREVLAYGGFKGSPELVLAFEGRRLPRAFIVLLENLLHKQPGARPSCARVKGAMKEGKFDPLVESSSRSTTNLTVAARGTGNGNGNGGNPAPAGSLPFGTGSTSGLGVSGTQPGTPGTPTTPTPASYKASGSTSASTAQGSRITTPLVSTSTGGIPPSLEGKLLALPSPVEVLGPEDGSDDEYGGHRQAGMWGWVKRGLAAVGLGFGRRVGGRDRDEAEYEYEYEYDEYGKEVRRRRTQRFGVRGEGGSRRGTGLGAGKGYRRRGFSGSGGTGVIGAAGGLGGKVLRSCVLVVKILTLPSLRIHGLDTDYHDIRHSKHNLYQLFHLPSSLSTSSMTRSVLIALLVGAAVADTVIDYDILLHTLYPPHPPSRSSVSGSVPATKHLRRVFMRFGGLAISCGLIVLHFGLVKALDGGMAVYPGS